MAEINIDHLLEQYASEIGRLTSELIKQRVILTTRIEELEKELQDLRSAD